MIVPQFVPGLMQPGQRFFVFKVLGVWIIRVSEKRPKKMRLPRALWDNRNRAENSENRDRKQPIKEKK